MKNKVKISVRDLVEFILQGGDLFSGFSGTSRNVEAIKAHQKIQDSSEEDYLAEVSVKQEVIFEDMFIEVSGRIDGVIQREGIVVIDEIKTTTIPLVQVEEDYTGNFRVEEAQFFPVGDDTTTRAYVTSPTGLTGSATVTGDIIEDPLQNWGLAIEGEILTFASGPNAGNYRLKTLVGTYGGPIGKATGPATKVKVASSILRVQRRMHKAQTGQAYKVDVDRLGKQTSRQVVGENVTSYFIR